MMENMETREHRAPARQEAYAFHSGEPVFVDSERDTVFSIEGFTEEKGVRFAKIKGADGQESFVEVSRLSPAATAEGKLDLLSDEDAGEIPPEGPRPN